MKKSLYVFLLLIVFVIGNVGVKASSGRLKTASIKTCNGVTYGQHSSDNHWHVATEKDGKYYATGNSIYSDPCRTNSSSSNHQSESNNNSSNNDSNSSGTSNNSSNGSFNTNSNNTTTKNEITIPKQEISKSSDNTLKVIIIDDNEYEAVDDIEYSTTKEKINIKAIPTDDKATYEIEMDSILSIGDNKITIEVKAEDGTIKIYNITIKREKVLSSNTGIKVVIDKEKIDFNNYKAKVYIESSVKSIDFDYILNDENAKVYIDKLSELKTGNNILNIKVTAEDGTEQNYEINIYKYSKTEDIVYTIVGFCFLGGIGYGIYYVIKKVKQVIHKL